MVDGDFGAIIRRRRDRLGLSSSRLAELIGRSPSSVRAWERGRSVPTDPEVLSSLAAVLGVDEGMLFAMAGVEPRSRGHAPTIEESLASIAPTRSREQEAPSSSAPGTTPPQGGAPGPSRAEPPRQDPEEAPPPLVERVLVLVERVRASRRAARRPMAGAVVHPGPPTGQPTVVTPSYLEDPEQRLGYRLRSLYTAIAVILSLVVLLWAGGKALEAFRATWDAVLGGL